MDIVRIAALGIVGVLVAAALKKERGEYAVLVAMTVCICIFFYLLTKVGAVLLFVEELTEMIPVDSRYIGLIIKMVGITYVAEFATDICRDAGYAAIGNQIEICAKLSILAVSIPVIHVFLETMGSFL